MKISEILNEGVTDQFLYHGVRDGSTVTQILKSGYIKPYEGFDFDADMDQQNDVKSVARISLSRNQYLHYPHGQAVAQFVIDKNALRNHGYKVVPKIGAMMHYKYETEEQVYKPIPIQSPFVVEIQYDPELKIPRKFLDHTKSMGVKVTPWREERVNPAVQTAVAAAPKKATEYTDASKVKIDGNGHTYGSPPIKVEPTEWYVSYSKPGGYSNELGPKSSDKAYIQKLYKQIKDRVAQGLTFDDLLPDLQHGKTWNSGYYEIQPGDKDYKKPKKPA